LLLETSDGLVEFDPVVGIWDRIGVIKDALRTGDEAAQVGVVVGKDPTTPLQASLNLTYPSRPKSNRSTSVCVQRFQSRGDVCSGEE
jgi:hypothetical protein